MTDGQMWEALSRIERAASDPERLAEAIRDARRMLRHKIILSGGVSGVEAGCSVCGWQRLFPHSTPFVEMEEDHARDRRKG